MKHFAVGFIRLVNAYCILVPNADGIDVSALFSFLGLISVEYTASSSYSFVYPTSIIMIGILINCIAGILLVLTGDWFIVQADYSAQQQLAHRLKPHAGNESQNGTRTFNTTSYQPDA
jgi:hypothetical protein